MKIPWRIKFDIKGREYVIYVFTEERSIPSTAQVLRQIDTLFNDADIYIKDSVTILQLTSDLYT